MYQIIDFARLRHISHIIWDIDGTITEKDILSQEATTKIINIGLKGIYHSFITGRDADWVIKNVIEQMKGFFNFTAVRDKLIFFAEVGCIKVTFDPDGGIIKTPHPQIEEHPLRKNEKIRGILKDLVYDPDKLNKYKKSSPPPLPPLELTYDANSDGYLIDRSKPAPRCYPYIWSPFKKAFATFEKIRNEKNEVRTFDQTPYLEIITKVIKDEGFEDSITTEEVATAINIVPVVDKLPLGKSWAAGMALKNIWKTKLGCGPSFAEVIDKTIAIGDGKADLYFTTPTILPELLFSVESKLKDVLEDDLRSGIITDSLRTIFGDKGGISIPPNPHISCIVENSEWQITYIQSGQRDPHKYTIKKENDKLNIYEEIDQPVGFYIPIIFVGRAQDLPSRGSSVDNNILLDNIIIQATGKGELQYDFAKETIAMIPATGPRVVSTILDFLKDWDYFVQW